MQAIILASASPRRQELLAQIGVRFTVRGQDIDESIHAGEPPRDYVQRMAQEKADSALNEIAAQPGAEAGIVLAADTSVVCDEAVLGKPGSEADAIAMLQRLSGRTHRVLSAVSVAASGGEWRHGLSESLVTFRAISFDEAQRYYRSGEPEGKAGAYAIQGYGAVFVERIEGSYSGVMGLPLFETAQLLNEFSVPMQAGERASP